MYNVPYEKIFWDIQLIIDTKSVRSFNHLHIHSAMHIIYKLFICTYISIFTKSLALEMTIESTNQLGNIPNLRMFPKSIQFVNCTCQYVKTLDYLIEKC